MRELWVARVRKCGTCWVDRQLHNLLRLSAGSQQRTGGKGGGGGCTGRCVEGRGNFHAYRGRKDLEKEARDSRLLNRAPCDVKRGTAWGSHRVASTPEVWQHVWRGTEWLAGHCSCPERHGRF